MQKLIDKRVLLIAPLFFGYEKVIAEQIRALGASVDHVSDRPDEKFLTKALTRINRKFIHRKNNRYYDEIVERAKEKRYDYIILVRGEAIDQTRVRQLKKHVKKELILYLWDSLSYNPNVTKIYSDFDRVLSFDKRDASTLKASYLPLFFPHEYASVREVSDVEVEYDCAFIGTIHTDRLKLLEKIKHQCLAQGIKLYTFYYYPSKPLFYLRCIVDWQFWRSRKDISFEGLSRSEIIDVFEKSNCILDVNRPKQDGLTIRTLEVFASRRKLITTNTNIKEFDLYDEGRVSFIDRREPVLDEKFMKQQSGNANLKQLERYSIENWVRELFI